MSCTFLLFGSSHDSALGFVVLSHFNKTVTVFFLTRIRKPKATDQRITHYNVTVLLACKRGSNEGLFMKEWCFEAPKNVWECTTVALTQIRDF